MIQITTTVTAPATASAPAGAYDLTDLPTVHSELAIPVTTTGDDSWLSMAITQVSAAIANYCNRVFQIEGLTDQIDIRQDPYPYQTPGGVSPLQLARWPLANLLTLPTNDDTPSGLVLPFGSAPPAWVKQGTPVSGLNIPPGDAVQSVSGDNVTLTSGIAGDIPSGTPITFGLSVAQTIAFGTKQAFVLGTDYTVDPATGQLIRLDPFTGVETTWEALPLTVSYYAGYTAIPADVTDACLRLVTARKFSRGENPFVKETEQPGLGRTTYWVGGPPLSGGMPQEIAGILDRYRVPVAF